jgi:ankyrin repeat protein
MSLNHLPSEMLLTIVEFLDRERDLNAFARSSRRLYVSLNALLYQRNVRRGKSSALLWAAENGRLSTAQMILDVGGHVHVERSSRHHCTALHLACLNGHVTVAALLIKYGALMEKTTPAGHTSLGLAVRYGHEPVARLLIESGANITRTSPTRHWGGGGKSLLHIASYLGHTSIVELLLENGADIDSRDAQRRTPLYDVAKFTGCRFSSSNWHFGISRGFRQYNYDSAWILIRRKQDLENISNTARFLFAMGANPLARASDGQTPRSIACRYPEPDIRSLLIRGGLTAFRQGELDRKLGVDMREKVRLVKEQLLAAEKQRKENAVKEIAERERLFAETRARRQKIKKEKAQLKANAKVQEALRLAREQRKLAAKQRKEADAERRASEARAREEAERAREQRLLRMRNGQAQSRSASRQRSSEEAQDENAGAAQVCARSHSSLVLKKNENAICEVCQKKCGKYSFQCPECRAVACGCCEARLRSV